MPSPPSTFLKVIGVNSFTDEDEDHRNNNNNNVNVDHFHSHSFSSSMDNLKPSIIIIILILAITLLLSISLFLLLRHLNRRFLRHPSSVSSTITAPPDATSRRASSRRISPENHTFSVIDSLPLFTFSSLARRSTTAGDCAVCLSKFEPHDQLRLLPLCCHAFHVHCIDTWLEFNQTCPLCRSPVVAMESDFLKAINESASVAGATESFRIEIGSISSRRQGNSETGEPRQRSYSIGSYDYIVDEPSDISVYRRSASDKEDIAIDNTAAHPALDTNLASEVAAGRSWLKDYVDRLSFSVSSRAASFRSSGRFFAGSSRRSDVGGFGDYDVEASRVGEEISEMFRWLSGYE